MSEKKMYTRICDRVGFDDEKHWKKGYTFLGMAEGTLGDSFVERKDSVILEFNRFGEYLRTHLAESVKVTNQP